MRIVWRRGLPAGRLQDAQADQCRQTLICGRQFMHVAIGEALRDGLHPFGLMLAHVSKTECGSMDLSVGDNTFGECATVEGFPPARRDHITRCGMSSGAAPVPRTRCANRVQKPLRYTRPCTPLRNDPVPTTTEPLSAVHTVKT